MARGLKLWIKKEEGWYSLCSENKGIDKLWGYRAALLFAKAGSSHDAAQVFTRITVIVLPLKEWDVGQETVIALA